MEAIAAWILSNESSDDAGNFLSAEVNDDLILESGEINPIEIRSEELNAFPFAILSTVANFRTTFSICLRS